MAEILKADSAARTSFTHPLRGLHAPYHFTSFLKKVQERHAPLLDHKLFFVLGSQDTVKSAGNPGSDEGRSSLRHV
jgi:hypothetical protein